MMSARIKKPSLTVSQTMRLSAIALLMGTGAAVAQDADRVAATAGNMSGSLSNERDRAAERVLGSAQQHVRSGRYAFAVRQLQELIESRSGSLVLREDVYRDAKDAGQQMLLVGPAALRETYTNVFGPLALHDLERALTGDNHARVWQVARDYQHTAAGRAASLHLWAVAADRGDWDAAREMRRRFEESRSALRSVQAGGRLARVLRRLTSAANPPATAADSHLPIPLQRMSAESGVRWRAEVRLSAEAQAEIAASLSELDAQAIVPLMSAKPLVRGGVAFSRRLGSLIAVSVESGDILWQRSMPTRASRLVEHTQSYGNSLRRSSSRALFLERFVRSSLTDRLTTDGTRVFAVIGDPVAQDQGQRDRNRAADSPRNMLVAFSAEDGRVLWRAGADFEVDEWSDAQARSRSSDAALSSSVPDRALRNVFFMGTPHVFGRWRLVVGQQQERVSLFALAAETGVLEWSVPLGHTVRPLLEDKPRHGTSCPVTVKDGRAYCATAVGCVACVDLASRRLLWAYRYPRSDLPKLADPENRQRADTTHATHMPTQETWHEVFLDVAHDRVLLASPESDWLHALDARMGQLRWRHRRGRGLYVAGPWDDRLLVVGTETATARAVDDGRVLWSTDILRPAGTGVVTATEYVFPSQSGGLQRVRWDDGQTRHDRREREDVTYADVGGRRIPVTFDVPSRLRPIEMVNLVAAEDAVMVQSFHELAAVTAGDEQETPSSRQATLSAADDDVSPSDRDLLSWPKLTRSAVIVASWNRVVTILRRAYPAGDLVLSTVDAVRGLLPRLRAPDERTAALITRLASAIREDEKGLAQSAQVGSLLQRLLRQPVDRLFVSLDRPRRYVRLDRWLECGFVETALNDPGARRQFAELWNSVAVRLTRSQAADNSALTTGAAADHATSQESRGSKRWPSVKPEVSEHAFNRGSVYVNTVPMTVTADSPWESVTVQVDRQGQHVWFLDANGSPSRPISLPPSHSSPRMTAEFLHAWANGPLLFLRIGTDLYGFRISATADALPTAPLWPRNSQILSVAGERPPFIAALAETSEDPRPVWDESLPSFFDNFSRQFAAVGPVTANTVCYQDRGHLVALDPETGRELWCRSDLPVGTRCLGDDDHLVLLREDSSSVEVLRSVDGKTVAEWDWRDVFDEEPRHAAMFSHIVAVRGTLALWHTHPPQQHGGFGQFRPEDVDPDTVSAAVIDLASGHTLWSRAVRPGSWVIKLDNDRLGALSPLGTLSILEWQSGKPLAEHAVEVPPQLTNVYVITDAQTSFVVASGRIDDPRLLQATQIRGAYRRPVVNGWMHAIERESGRHLWQQRWDNIGLIRDQPRHVPLLVTSYTVTEGKRNRNTGVLKCIDRRTGETLYDYSSQAPYIYHSVQSNAAEDRIDVVTQDTIIRFQYAVQD